MVQSLRQIQGEYVRRTGFSRASTKNNYPRQRRFGQLRGVWGKQWT
jgi:hypothetical protein